MHSLHLIVKAQELDQIEIHHQKRMQWLAVCYLVGAKKAFQVVLLMSPEKDYHKLCRQPKNLGHLQYTWLPDGQSAPNLSAEHLHLAPFGRWRFKLCCWLVACQTDSKPVSLTCLECFLYRLTRILFASSNSIISARPKGCQKPVFLHSSHSITAAPWSRLFSSSTTMGSLVLQNSTSFT